MDGGVDEGAVLGVEPLDGRGFETMAQATRKMNNELTLTVPEPGGMQLFSYREPVELGFVITAACADGDLCSLEHRSIQDPPRL
jgi:hypothetical protein